MLHGHYPVSTLLRAHLPPLSPPCDFPVLPVIHTGCSTDFAMGRGGFLQLLCASLPSCRHYHPARVDHRISQLQCAMLSSPVVCRLDPWCSILSRPPRVHLRYGPMTRTIPGDRSRMVCRWASGHQFPSYLPSSYGVLTLIPTGLTPVERASLRWTHIPMNSAKTRSTRRSLAAQS